MLVFACLSCFVGGMALVLLGLSRQRRFLLYAGNFSGTDLTAMDIAMPCGAPVMFMAQNGW